MNSLYCHIFCLLLGCPKMTHNGLQLKEVADLKQVTVYTHQTLLVAKLFLSALRPPFFLGAVSGSLFFFGRSLSVHKGLSVYGCLVAHFNY